MTPEQLDEGLRLLELCEASPDDLQAQCVAAWVRQTMDVLPVDPFAVRMRGARGRFEVGHDVTSFDLFLIEFKSISREARLRQPR